MDFLFYPYYYTVMWATGAPDFIDTFYIVA